MTPLESLPVSDWGILLALAVALGASLYVGILALSLFPLLPETPATFGPLALLATTPVTIAAALLYMAVWAVRGHPFLEYLWEITNVGARFFAVALLSLIVIGGPVSPAALAAALGAGAIAAFIQLLRTGWMLLDHHSDWVPARRWIQKLGGDTAAAGLLWMTLILPWIGTLAAGVALIGVIVVSRPAYRAGKFALLLLLGLLRGIPGTGGWRQDGAVPRWVRNAIQVETPIPVHATPVAFVWGRRASSFRSGWIVLSGRKPLFLFRTFTRLWEVPLEGMAVGATTSSPHLMNLELADAEGGISVLLPRGGPAGSEVGGAIAGAAPKKNL